MKNFKRSNLVTALLTIFLLAISTNQAQANMFNRFREGFYFEKYKTAEEAKAALLEMHPIGSSVESLIKTLEGAGAKVTEDSEGNLENYKKFKQYDKWWKEGTVKILHYEYDKASPFFVVLNYIQWKGGIWVDKNDKIIFLGVHKGRAY